MGRVIKVFTVTVDSMNMESRECGATCGSVTTVGREEILYFIGSF